MKFYTANLTSGQSITLAAADNVMQFTFKVASSSSGTFKGNGTFQGSSVNATQSLAAGDGFSAVATNPMSPIEGITLTCTSGTIIVTIGTT